MIGEGWATECVDELISNGWIQCFLYVVKTPPSEEDETGGKRTFISKTELSQKQLQMALQEDEELIAVVAMIGKMIL